jgi:phosphate transport system permease protein
MVAQPPAQPNLHRSLQRSYRSPRTLLSLGLSGLVWAFAAIALLPLLAVLSYVLVNGFSSLSPALFTELPPPPLVKGGGFGNALVGTFSTVGLAALLSIPFGVLAAVFLSEFARDTRLASWINFATNVLSGVPSIVVGVFAYALVVIPTGRFSAVAGGVALAVLMLPTVVRTATESLELVSQELRQAAIGLGASRFQTVFGVVLPAALPSIVTGVMLAVARAAGETAPVIFTALFSQYWNKGLWEPTATLSVMIFNFATVPYKNQQQLAWAGSLILVLLVLLTSIISRWSVSRRSAR